MTPTVAELERPLQRKETRKINFLLCYLHFSPSSSDFVKDKEILLHEFSLGKEMHFLLENSIHLSL